VSTVATVTDVLARMRTIDAATPAQDGVAVFNRVYLAVTEMVLERLRSGGVFQDDAFMTALDVRFAGLWFAAYDSRRGATPKAWAPLFERRADDRLFPLQFALAGMNAHIEHDLPLAVAATCAARGREPRDVRDDYELVNDLLAGVEAGIRRSFLTEVEREVDDRVGPVAHLVSAWNIDKARDVAWANLCLLWELRGTGFLRDLYRSALGRTVGMGSRLLLTPPF
jgi:hypothetical protein